MNNDPHICSRCILDSSLPDIQFDDDGICNYCKIHDDLEEKYPLNEFGQQKLNQLIKEIKSKGRNKKYDCVVGTSGGLDSIYCLYLTKKYGLRPLAVHLDNKWNSKIAISNMEKATEKLGVDLRIVTVDWEEFRDLQIAFLKASVPDAEIPTDIGIKSILYQTTAKEGLHYFVYGNNFRTEGIVPRGWTHMDGKYIKSVYKEFGTLKLRSYPNCYTYPRLFYYTVIKGIRVVRLLNYIDYNRRTVMETLEKELSWEDYGGKHYESIYTRFFQSYVLPKKFNIDKRIVHFSALIRSGQMTREEALHKIKEDPYPAEKVKEDMQYVIKKLDITKEEFEDILSRPPKTFLDYSTYYPIIKAMKYVKKTGLWPRIA